ncbi:hypothetical protein CLIB1444_02S16248 [[Candida] jaroonii]|uniref:Uncharacterized protein n=1 Tax=[Candida] jaroonii TaxID=467808 RepID=A0ACA9Y4S3_9ASCO|nr:hypothetical protein CLIB1444_02S16248 [[Candida] jaroonii]
MNSWLFHEKDVIYKSPSRKSMTMEQELRNRESIYDFIIKLGSNLKIDAKTIFGATILVNRYYMRIPITTSKYFVACAAMAISCKLHDTYRLPDNIALIACRLKNPTKVINDNSEIFWQWRDQLLFREELMLKTLNFDLNIDFPYDLRNDLMEFKSDNDVFEDKKLDIMKNTVSVIELVSSLPILMSYEMNIVYGTILIIVVLEANERFNMNIKLPKDYIRDQLNVDINLCLKCYRYLLALIDYSNRDVKCISNKPATKRIRKVTDEEMLSVVDESIEIRPRSERPKGEKSDSDRPHSRESSHYRPSKPESRNIRPDRDLRPDRESSHYKPNQTSSKPPSHRTDRSDRSDRSDPYRKYMQY